MTIKVLTLNKTKTADGKNVVTSAGRFGDSEFPDASAHAYAILANNRSISGVKIVRRTTREGKRVELLLLKLRRGGLLGNKIIEVTRNRKPVY